MIRKSSRVATPPAGKPVTKPGNLRLTKIAAITGAASGIGLGTARRLLGEGWTVIGLDRARDGLDAAKTALGDGFRPVVCDLASAEGVAAAFREVATQAAFVPPTR